MPWRLFQSPLYDDGTTATATAVSNNWLISSQQATASATSVYTNSGPYTTAVYAYWTNEPTTPQVARWAGNENQLATWHQQAALNQAQLAMAQQQQRDLARQGELNSLLPQHQPQRSPAPPAFRPAAPPIILTLAEEEERAREREARRADAEATARALLLRFLDDEQALEFERTQSFYVIGKSGARYRICWGKVANIHVVDSPRVLHDPLVGRRLCVHPADSHILPVHDVMLAQLLHLRANDVETRRIANVH